MHRRKEKKWDDYIKKTAVCTPDFTVSYPFALPATPGKTNENEKFPFDDFVEMTLPTLQSSRSSPSDSVLVTQRRLLRRSFTLQNDFGTVLPGVDVQSLMLTDTKEDPKRRSVDRATRSASRSDARKDSESRAHDISSAGSPRRANSNVALKRNKSTPALSSLAGKKSESAGRNRPAAVKLHASDARFQDSGALLSVSAHFRFLRKLRKAERQRMKRERRENGGVVEKPLEKLRRILRSIRIIVEVCLALKRYAQRREIPEPLTLVQMQLNLQDDLNKKLTFNPHYYSASYVANKGSSKLKKLLSIAPEARTKSHVKMIHALVQNRNAFSKYPVSIRLKMCQVMIYQSYESKRVIIKQGHPPSAFYIILSGTCLINEKVTGDRGEEVVQTINEIKEGEVFGEVALLHKTVRTASVVCKDDVELLVFYKEEFDAIVRKPIYKQREEVIDFCKKLDILQEWPVTSLGEASFANFQYQFYRNGSVIVKDSSLSNFLVFVKSGECRIVCTLDGDEHSPLPSETAIRTRSLQQTSIVLPLLDNNARMRAKQTRSLSLAVKTPKINNFTVPALHPPLVEIAPTIPPNPRKRPRKNGENGHWENEKQMYNEIYDRKLQITQQTLSLISSNSGSPLTRVTLAGPFRMSEIGNLQPAFFSRDKQKRVDQRHTVRPSVMEDTPYTLSKDGKLHPIRVTSTDQRDQHRLFPPTKKSTNSFPKNEKPEQKTPKAAPKFAQIAVLKSGCVFGLEELMKRTRLHLSLVSDGSECVFISKKLFLKLASAKTLRRVNGMVGRYPTEDYVRHQLAELTGWCRFREDVVRDVLDRRDERDAVPMLKIH